MRRKELNFYEHNITEALEDARMMFVEHIEDSSRRLVKMIIEDGLRMEMDEHIGSGWYKRSKKRRGRRCGYRKRKLLSRFGEIEIVVPRSRDGEFRPKTIPLYKRVEEKVNVSIMNMYIRGVSMEKVSELLESMYGYRLSKSYISGIMKRLKWAVEEFHCRELADRYKYLILDGIYFSVKSGNGVKRRVVLVAFGITEDGRKEFVDFMVGGQKESYGSWVAFLRVLRDRGLRGSRLKLIVTDGDKGLLKAIEEVYAWVRHQLCWVHKLWNVSKYVPSRYMDACIGECKGIYNANGWKEGVRRFKRWKRNWHKKAPRAVWCVEKDIDRLLNFYKFPQTHWVRIRTTNAIERCFKEIRRREKVLDRFPNRDSLERVVYSIVNYFNVRWQRKPNYLKNFDSKRKVA